MSSRRKFLEQSLAITGGIGLAGVACTSRLATTEVATEVIREAVTEAITDEPLYKISLAQWSLNRTLRSGDLDHLDFINTAKNEYGIHAVEYVDQFFSDKAKDMDYLREMNSRADGEGVTQVLIMIDTAGSLGAADDASRQQAVENHYQWVDAAKFLGCHSIRVNARSSGSYEEQMKLAIDGLRGVTEYGAQNDINIIVENHGGLSSNGKWLTAVIEGVDHPRCGTLPDFGNFRVSAEEEYDRYLGVQELMPYAKGASAKTHDFDENGNEINTDYFRMMRIVLDAGYRGHVGIEYEGRNLSEPDGIRATKLLLERVREQLIPEYT